MAAVQTTNDTTSTKPVSFLVEDASKINPVGTVDALANAEDMVKFLRRPNPRKPRLAIPDDRLEALFKPIDLPELPQVLQYRRSFPLPPELFYGIPIAQYDFDYQLQVQLASSKFRPYGVLIEPVFGCEEFTIASFYSNRESRLGNPPQELIDYISEMMGKKPKWYLSILNSHWSFL